MENNLIHLLGVVAVGWAVTFGLRALPFLLFAGSHRELPPWVDRLGRIISPVIIAALIVYSYSGLAWRTWWPYLAGGLTVALQLWRRNPLVSIIAGTALYMMLVTTGCASVSMMNLDPANPDIRVTEKGCYLGDEPSDPAKIVKALRKCGIPTERVIHIKLDPEAKDLSQARFLMAVLGKVGYTRPVLVTARHGESYSIGKRKPQ